MYTFSSPQYIQTKDKKPAYHFSISGKEPLVITSNDVPELAVSLASNDGVEHIKLFTEEFAKQCSKYFPKPLLPERLATKLTHIMKTIDDNHNGDGIVMWHLIPDSICVSGILLQVFWKIIKTTSIIQWEAVEEEEAEVEAVAEVEAEAEAVDEEEVKSNEIEEVDAVNIENTTGEDTPQFILGPSAATKEKEKKKLREAKLQVELARFRAARAYEKYVAKYGDDLSDTDTEGEESEYE